MWKLLNSCRVEGQLCLTKSSFLASRIGNTHIILAARLLLLKDEIWREPQTCRCSAERIPFVFCSVNMSVAWPLFLRVSRWGFKPARFNEGRWRHNLRHMFSMENTLHSVRSLMASNFFLNIFFFFLTTITSSNHYMPNVISCGRWAVIISRCMNDLKFGFKDFEKGAQHKNTILKTHSWRPQRISNMKEHKGNALYEHKKTSVLTPSSNMWIWLCLWKINISNLM